jgi:hypothetical protein
MAAKTYLKSYFSRREAEAFVDGATAAGWFTDELDVVAEEPESAWKKTQFVVYRLTRDPQPAPTKPALTPRRKLIR